MGGENELKLFSDLTHVCCDICLLYSQISNDNTKETKIKKIKGLILNVLSSQLETICV